MKKIAGAYYFEKTLNDKLENYCEKQPFNIGKNNVITVALEGFLLNDVNVEDMTQTEAKKKWNEVNTKIQQLKDLENKLYLRLED